jgi:hypothetical protein
MDSCSVDIVVSLVVRLGVSRLSDGIFTGLVGRSGRDSPVYTLTKSHFLETSGLKISSRLYLRTFRGPAGSKAMQLTVPG